MYVCTIISIQIQYLHNSKERLASPLGQRLHYYKESIDDRLKVGHFNDFGYLIKAYRIIYTHICYALESVTLSYQKPVGTSINLFF